MITKIPARERKDDARPSNFIDLKNFKRHAISCVPKQIQTHRVNAHKII